MQSNIPQNAEEAAYLSYALLDALGDMLISKGIIHQEDINAILEAAAVSLSETSNFAGNQGADFIRKIRLSKK